MFYNQNIKSRRGIMVISTPENKTTCTSANRNGTIWSIISPIPKLACELAVLSFRVTLAVLVATFRLVIPNSKKSLIGETVLITGAGGGIGRELASQLSALGCIVVCWDIDPEANRSIVKAISQDGGEAYGYAVDVSKRSEVQEAVRMMREAKIPEVSVLVNNAAILMHKAFLEHEERDVARTFEVNVLSHFWTLQAVLPSMLKNNRGHVVSMCSMCGFYGVLDKVPYCASKYAVRGMMDGLMEELRLTIKDAQKMIKFTSVYPFYVGTGLAQDPRYRFPWLFEAVPAKYAAAEVIRAIQRNYEECTIPRCLLYLDAINRILPKEAMRLIIDFLAQVDKTKKPG